MALHPARPAHQGQDPRRIPYDMFTAPRAAAEVASARKLAGIYHKGQERVWDGRELLGRLAQKHGGVQLPEDQRRALGRLLNVIFWGVLAAWKISAELALELEPLEAKMAATSQAFDEARHFYVLHDYLELLGHRPGPLTPASTELLARVAGARDLTRKLVGMQMMVEPLALTLFQFLRERAQEPVLSELLVYYERDEARHVALGILHLPALLRSMSPPELLRLWRWQWSTIHLQMEGLVELVPEFHTLGLSPREVYRVGQRKQLAANKALAEQLGMRQLNITPWFIRYFEGQLEYLFPEDGRPHPRPERLRRAWRAARDARVDLGHIEAMEPAA